MGAQALVESTVFENSKACVVSEAEVDGYAVVKDVVTNSGYIDAPKGTLNSVPYSYSVLGSGNVKSAVIGKAGATLTFNGSPSNPPTDPPPGGDCSPLFGQCGGSGWSGPKCCSQGSCKVSNEWYSQCL